VLRRERPGTDLRGAVEAFDEAVSQLVSEEEWNAAGAEGARSPFELPRRHHDVWLRTDTASPAGV